MEDAIDDEGVAPLDEDISGIALGVQGAYLPG